MASTLIQLAGTWHKIFAGLPIALRTACLILLVIAAARPQFYNISRDVRIPGVDIVLALDTSKSMADRDFKLSGEPVSRLVAVKKVVSDFIEKRETDRIGLVVFGSEAFTQSPLTLDKGLLLELVNRMQVGMAGDMTAIGDGIAVGAKRLKALKAKSKILILLTDGDNNSGQVAPEQAAEAASVLGIRIYTIGVGMDKSVSYEKKSIHGDVVMETTPLDEVPLQKIAHIGQGKYFRAADSDELSEIYHIIDQAEKTDVRVKDVVRIRDLYGYFLLPALLFLILEVLLKSTILRTIP